MGRRRRAGDGSHDEAAPDDEFDRVVDRARSGDAAAIDMLVRSVDRRLVGFLRARGAEDPEGAANEVLVRACRSIETFEGNHARFRSWVFSIARNLLIDEHRASQRRVATSPERPEDLARRAGAIPLPSRLEERERIDELLDGLTDDQREVMVLRVVAGLSVDDVARVLGRRPGAVRALQHRALGRLRSQIVAEGA